VITKSIFRPVYANDNSALIPEVWAMEGLMLLHENLVIGNLVHRDFSSEVANYGDVVNVHRPNKFQSVRKRDGQPVNIQAAKVDNVRVPLNQWLHTSFMIYDGEQTKSMKDLFEVHLRPAMQSLAQKVDLVLLGQKYKFYGPNIEAGVIPAGALNTTPVVQTLVDTNTNLDLLLAPSDNRNLIISPRQHGSLAGLSTFHEADKVGDNGTALREGSLGRKFGMNIFMSQNSKTVSGLDKTTGAVDNTGGYAAGATVIATSGFTSSTIPIEGSMIVIAGDNTPQMVTDVTGANLTIAPGLKSAVVDTAVITNYGMAQFDDDYDPGHIENVEIKSYTNTPPVGSGVYTLDNNGMWAYGLTPTLDSDGNAIPSNTELELNSQLVKGVSEDDYLGFFPEGDYGFAFHRNALALVSRPLVAPRGNVMSAAQSFENLSLRVTMSYDGRYQGTLVNVDMLMGTEVLDPSLGTLMLS